jgi:glucoamylase
MEVIFNDSASAVVANHTSILFQSAMYFLSASLLLGVAGFHHLLAWSTPQPKLRLHQGTVDSFIQRETPIALEQLLCNIGPDGCHAQGAASGAVIASPDKVDPPYFYTWTRDSALVFKCLIDRFTNHYDAGLQSQIQQYIAAQARLQGVSNPSGQLPDGSGLGEAKYNVDLSQYSDAWGQ